jgi:hypothetical protein
MLFRILKGFQVPRLPAVLYQQADPETPLRIATNSTKQNAKQFQLIPQAHSIRVVAPNGIGLEGLGRSKRSDQIGTG